MMSLLVAALLGAAPVSAQPLPWQQPQPAPVADTEGDHSEAWRAHLATQRALQIARLRAYAGNRVFPINDDQPGMLNIFMDEEGRRCAMAELIWQSGRADLVRTVSQTRNDLKLGEVSEGPLMDWILTSGLTQEEVAFVQEPDFFIDQGLPPEVQIQITQSEQDRLSSHFLAAAAQLEAYGDASLETALARLGDRVHAPPPGEAVATARWGWLR